MSSAACRPVAPLGISAAEWVAHGLARPDRALACFADAAAADPLSHEPPMRMAHHLLELQKPLAEVAPHLERAGARRTPRIGRGQPHRRRCALLASGRRAGRRPRDRLCRRLVPPSTHIRVDRSVVLHSERCARVGAQRTWSACGSGGCPSRCPRRGPRVCVRPPGAGWTSSARRSRSVPPPDCAALPRHRARRRSATSPLRHAAAPAHTHTDTPTHTVTLCGRALRACCRTSTTCRRRCGTRVHLSSCGLSTPSTSVYCRRYSSCRRAARTPPELPTASGRAVPRRAKP